jgi:4-alpha-glucanotransferase
MIAEDLGHVTPADVQLRDSFGLAPMRIFQFGFGSEEDSSDHLPHNYPRLCAAYTGNHDNNAAVGWFREQRPAQRKRVLVYTGASDSGAHWGFIRTLMASPANAVIFPMQDALGLDGTARLNVPGTVEGNWSWRLAPGSRDQSARQLHALAESFGRTSKSTGEARPQRRLEKVKAIEGRSAGKGKAK